ncbi:hypothetical protein ACJ72_07883, partial [Emergomyces africanus]
MRFKPANDEDVEGEDIQLPLINTPIPTEKSAKIIEHGTSIAERATPKPTDNEPLTPEPTPPRHPEINMPHYRGIKG